jgi:putative peptidoglycan lipid II flippase
VPYPIISVLFQRGAFTAETAHLSAQALAAYATGLPAFVLVKVLVPAFFARGDTAMPVKIAMLAVGLNIALNFMFMVPLRHLGPPLASSVSSWFNVLALAFVLHRRGHLVMDAHLRRTAPLMLVAGLAMGGLLLVLDHFAFTGVAGVMRWVGLGVLVAGGLIGYAAAGQVIGAFDLWAMVRGARRSP